MSMGTRQAEEGLREDLESQAEMPKIEMNTHAIQFVIYV